MAKQALSRIGQLVSAWVLSVATVPLVAACFSMDIWRGLDVKAGRQLAVVALALAIPASIVALVATRGMARTRPLRRAAIVCVGVPVGVGVILFCFILFLRECCGPAPSGL
jgi:hypothetical protein